MGFTTGALLLSPGVTDGEALYAVGSDIALTGPTTIHPAYYGRKYEEVG